MLNSRSFCGICRASNVRASNSLAIAGPLVPKSPRAIEARRWQHNQNAPLSSEKHGKALKEEYKTQRRERRQLKEVASVSSRDPRLVRWNLTVGLEIHAQLNTPCKLFSASRASVEASPNSNVAIYDLAFPGSQPVIQKEILLPAIRAALALNCEIQHEVQLEQDTAKSVTEAPSSALLDFNRVGHPLIEIITHPDMHSAQEAAACAKRIMLVLQSVNAISAGMEMGGLRADVNVSVSPKGSNILGKRTEIKNVSSFKAIEQAVLAEQSRQIEVLENGGTVQSETRGWTLGETETVRLRGKEGEVDYRYMPDPDVPPLFIDEVRIMDDFCIGP